MLLSYTMFSYSSWYFQYLLIWLFRIPTSMDDIRGEQIKPKKPKLKKSNWKNRRKLKADGSVFNFSKTEIYDSSHILWYHPKLVGPLSFPVTFYVHFNFKTLFKVKSYININYKLIKYYLSTIKINFLIKYYSIFSSLTLFSFILKWIQIQFQILLPTERALRFEFEFDLWFRFEVWEILYSIWNDYLLTPSQNYCLPTKNTQFKKK